MPLGGPAGNSGLDWPLFLSAMAALGKFIGRLRVETTHSTIRPESAKSCRLSTAGKSRESGRSNDRNRARPNPVGILLRSRRLDVGVEPEQVRRVVALLERREARVVVTVVCTDAALRLVVAAVVDVVAGGQRL